MKRGRQKKHRSRAEKASRRYQQGEKPKERREGRQGGRRHGGKHAPRQHAKVRVGRVQKNPRGFAFLISTEEGFPDVYVGQREASQLMNDDVVEFTVESRGRRDEARIQRVIKRGQTAILGEVREGRSGPILQTETGEIHELDGAKARDIGSWVIAKIEEYPSEQHAGLVTIQEHLGSELSPKHDIPIAIARYNLADEFSVEARRVAEHARVRALEELEHAGERVDHRDLPFVTIDGEDAKDFDDAILVESGRGEAAFILYVAIADVSFFVERGSALDREAFQRGTSVYFPGWCLPMLPESLSNDMCSLRPQTDKLAFTAEMEFDRDGNALEAKFYPSKIRTARRLTYTQVQSYLDSKDPNRHEIADVGPQLDRAYELYRKLLKQRAARGVLDFDLPESKITVDPQGRPIACKRAERHDSHKLIEEFMIAANRAVAKALRESKTLTLYRVHEPPDLAKLEELNTTLRNLGISMYLKDLKPKTFAKVLEATKDLPIAPTLHQQILRMQQQAHYEPEPKGHFGLALRDYAHFTSPIRRYPDLVVHRSLNAMLAKRQTRLSLEEFTSMGERTSQAERRAMEAERWVTRRKQCWFMEQHLGKEFDGRISGVVNSGLFVEIPEFALDGFVPIEYLHGNYQLDERHMCLRKRPGNELLKVGDPIRVEVVKVSVDENQITLGAVKLEPTRSERTERPEKRARPDRREAPEKREKREKRHRSR